MFLTKLCSMMCDFETTCCSAKVIPHFRLQYFSRNIVMLCTGPIFEQYLQN